MGYFVAGSGEQGEEGRKKERRGKGQVGLCPPCPRDNFSHSLLISLITT